MRPHEFIGITCRIYHLAWLNWVKDGRPQGLDMEYWLAAESLLTRNEREMMVDEKLEFCPAKRERNIKSPARKSFGSRKRLRNLLHRRGSDIESPKERMAL
jgi:hypothetical protein